MLQTAELNGLDSEAYLADVIDRMAKGRSITRLAQLLPWNWPPKPSKPPPERALFGPAPFS